MYEQSEKYSVTMIPGKGYEVLGEWKDDVHDIRTRMLFDYETYQVIEAEATGLTTPFGEVCQVGLDNMNKMVGQQVGPGWAGRVKEQLMGKAGCIHLGEMVIKSFKSGLAAASRTIPDWVEAEDYTQRWAGWETLYKDSCIYFAQPNAMENLMHKVHDNEVGKSISKQG